MKSLRKVLKNIRRGTAVLGIAGIIGLSACRSIEDFIITSDPVTEVNEGGLYIYPVSVENPGDDLECSLLQAPNWLSVSRNTNPSNSYQCLVTGTAPFVSSDKGESVSLAVVSEGVSYGQNYTITNHDINYAPTMSPIPTQSANEDSSFSYDVAQHVSDADLVEGDTDLLTYSLTNAPNWLSINSGTGMISGTTPSVNANTIFNVNARVSDSHEEFAEQTFQLPIADNSNTDTTAPNLNIVYPLSGDIVRGDKTISFTDDELTNPECSFNSTEYVPCINGMPLSEISGFSALQDGEFNFYLRDTDAVGNTGTDSEVGIIKDTISPLVEIVSPQNDSMYASQTVQLAFRVTDATSTQCNYKLNLGNETPVPCGETVNLTASENRNDLEVLVTDTAGNSGSARVGFDVDTTAPEIGITRDFGDGLSGEVIYTISALDIYRTAEIGVRLNNLEAQVFQNPNPTQNYQITLTTPIVEGSNLAQATAMDGNGNLSEPSFNGFDSPTETGARIKIEEILKLREKEYQSYQRDVPISVNINPGNSCLPGIHSFYVDYVITKLNEPPTIINFISHTDNKTDELENKALLDCNNYTRKKFVAYLPLDDLGTGINAFIDNGWQ